MNARNIIRIQSSFDAGAAKVALAVARLQLASLVDAFVAGWLQRVATNAEAAQRLLPGKTSPHAHV